MHIIQPGFSLLAALLAVGITVATRAAVFRHAPVAPGVADCYTNITYGTPPACKATHLVLLLKSTQHYVKIVTIYGMRP